MSEQQQIEDFVEGALREAGYRLAEPGTDELPVPRHLSLIGRDIHEILLILRLNLSDISDEWEDLLMAGRAIVEAGDTDRFALGDLAILKVIPRYGEGRIDEFADAIGVARSTMYQYIAVSRTFQLSIRSDILETCKSLTWSHFFQASRVITDYKDAELFDQDLDVAISFLYSAQEQNWAARNGMKKAVDKYLHKGKSAPKMGEFEGDITQCAAWITKAMLGQLKEFAPEDFDGPIRVALFKLPKPAPKIEPTKEDLIAAGLPVPADAEPVEVEVQE